jgi:hypothetical protein
MNDFDDSVLRDQLQRLGGHGPDEAGAYLALQQRVGVAKRRRAAAVVGGLGVTLMIGFAAAAYQPPSSSRLVPANGGGNDAVVTLPTTVGNADTTSSSTVISTPTINGNTDNNGNTNSDNANNPGNSNPSTSAPQTGTDSTTPSPIDVPATTAHTVPHGHATTSAPATTTAPTVPATTSTEPSTSSSVPTNFIEDASASSSGGTATAHLQGGVVSLVSYSATADHDCIVERTLSDRVRITCRPTLLNTVGNTSHLDFSIGLDGHLVAVSTET